MPVDETNLMKIGQDPFLCINPDSKKMSDTLVHNTEYYNKLKKRNVKQKISAGDKMTPGLTMDCLIDSNPTKNEKTRY